MNFVGDLNKIKWATLIGGFLYLPWYWIMPVLYPETWNPFLPRFLIVLCMWATSLLLIKKPEVLKEAKLIFDFILYLIVVHHFVMVLYNPDEIIYRYTFFMVSIMAGSLVHSFRSYLLVFAISIVCKLFLVFSFDADFVFEVFEIGIWFIQFVIIGIIIKANFEIRNEIQAMTLKSAEDAKVIALGTMSGGIAHEINNPLAIIKSTVDLLQRKAGQDRLRLLSESMNELERISFSVDRVAKIVSNLQSMTKKVSSEPLVLENLCTIMTEFSDLVKNEVAENSIQFKMFEVPQVNVRVRKQELLQALKYIVDNSISALKDSEAKSLSINFRLETGSIKIDIQDSGPGISESIRSRIMDPFFTTKDVGQGYGLGLSLAKAIIESFQGSLICLKCESGAHFQISLPT